MKSARALELFSHTSELAIRNPDAGLYRAIEGALNELIGFKLLTILRLKGARLVRTHTSDSATYPSGGYKDITDDQWLRSILSDGVPVISEDSTKVRERFVDHEAIFAMGCGSVLNIPVTSALGTLGSLNLLHEAYWFKPEHIVLVRPYALLLAVPWLAEEAHNRRP
ncbi:GAF domain-containing protein [Collimonas pratensis]|uniref:GAF domain-containing protein n=1 Tax=Collimonas pratensis TaxID=279113 RepID=UPI00143DF96E|nr:GAF domain-containing protein [Collimonas pratensis]NKI72739.1 GAF domain-containing protein [Collimonas pratensis]